MGKLVISIEFAAEELKLEEKAHTPKGVALCFMHFRPLLLPLSTGSEKFHFRGRGKAMLLEVEWPEVRQMAKRAPFWLLLLDQTWQVMGSTCFDLGAQIARAAAAGVAERETEMDSFGLLTAQMLSTHGNQQVASLDCAFRVGCIRDASYTSNASVGDVKDKLRELPKVVEDMPLDPFIEDITVTAAPVSAPTDAPGPPDRDAILAERGPAGAAGPALGQCTGESLESIVVGKRETAKTGKTKPGEQVGKDSLDRSDNLELPSEQLGSCTLSISALTLVSEMTRELMGEEKKKKLERQRGNMLTISDATMYDTGRYNCIVKNPAGEASAETYVQILPSRCGAFVVAYDNITFTLQSENYPWPYRKAKSCSWRVCPPQGKKLQFNFTTFDLRTFDKLEIINECDRHHHPWRRYCGSRVTPGYFVSRCNTTCVQIVLDSGILPNRVATGFQATVTTTDQESTEFNITDQICESNLVARVKSNILFEVDLEIRVQVLEIFKQDEPRFTYEGQEITVKHDFIITDMFGCSLKIRAGKEYFIFASLQKELSDFLDSSPYLMNFVVDPKSTNTPANFQEQLDSMKTDLPRCRPPLLSEP